MRRRLNESEGESILSEERFIGKRKNAIKEAIKKLDKNDILLIAGKGHEKHQEVKGRRYFFDDREVVINLIKEMEV